MQRLLFLLAATSVPAVVWAEKVTYDDHILPLFESNCLNCHNPDKTKGGLDLSTYANTLAGGSSGETLQPGAGADALLYRVITHQAEPVMPPEGDQLSKKDANLVRTWIDDGLLETSSSTAKTAKKNTLLANLEPIDPQKFDGPPPMVTLGTFPLDPVQHTPRSGTILDMEASPRAPLLAITGHQQVVLYHTETFEILGIIPFEGGTPEALSFHPGGQYLTVAGGVPGKKGFTRTWDLVSGQVILELGREFDSVLTASLHPALTHLALGGPSKTVKIWSATTGEEVHRLKKHPEWVTAASFSASGANLATADRNQGIQLWETEDFTPTFSLESHEGPITDLKWRPDSRILASASEDAHIILWDTKTGKQIKKHKAHDQGVLALDLAPDGLVMTAGRDKKVRFWKADLGFRQELKDFSDIVTEVEFSHDGKTFFTADWRGQLRAWTIEGFRPLTELTNNPRPFQDRLADLRTQIANFKSDSQSKQDELKQQQLLLAEASDPDPETEKVIGALKGAIGRLHHESEALTKRLSELEKFANK